MYQIIKGGFLRHITECVLQKNAANDMLTAFLRYLIELILAGCSPAEPASASFDKSNLWIINLSTNSRIKIHCKIKLGLLLNL